MSFQGLSAILLFTFTIPIVMKYRILPIEGTPYWLFGILFFSLIGFGIYSLAQKKITLGKGVLLWICIAISLGGASITAIADRHRIAPVWQTHDIILQQEAAMRYLLQKKNPNKETYFGTPVEMFHYDELGDPTAINPALYHFVMPPGYLLLPFPFYWVANRAFGYFDGRMVSIVCMVGLLVILSRWFKRRDIAEIAIIITALSPAATDYFIEGRSDLFALFWLVFSLFLLDKKKYLFSSLIMGIAITTKQTIWFAFPLWCVFMWTQVHNSFKKTLIYIVTACTVGALITLPFLVWDPQAFLNSVIFYLSAGGKTGYPVSGYGMSMILYSTGIIKGLHDYFPFMVLQLIFGIPTLFATIWFLIKKPSIWRFFIGFSLTLFAFWYTSRYFNNSHIAVVAGLFALGILKKYDEESKQTEI